MNSNIKQNLQIIERLLADKAWWAGFLKEGAFFRESEESCWVWFHEHAYGALRIQESIDVSISYKDFFKPDTFGLGSGQVAIEVPYFELRRALSRQLDYEMVQLPSLMKQADFSCSTKESFEQSLREILPKIHRGEIEKAVPVSFTRSAKIPTNVDKLKWMQGALNSPSNLWAYGFWKEDFQGIIGATPEILFDLKEGRLETMALAGTMPKSEAHQRGSLLNDAKERWEHDLVVRDLKTQLGKLGGVICGNTEVIELPTLFHLRTLLQVNLSSGIFSKGDIRKSMVEQIVQLLHPTPALGVAPRSYGYQWLRDLPDQAERKYHGAPVCISLPHRTICLVAIRNIQWNNKGTQIGAGCGIVKESQLDREWSEITQKINSVFQVLGIE